MICCDFPINAESQVFVRLLGLLKLNIFQQCVEVGIELETPFNLPVYTTCPANELMMISPDAPSLVVIRMASLAGFGTTLNIVSCT